MGLLYRLDECEASVESEGQDGGWVYEQECSSAFYSELAREWVLGRLPTTELPHSARFHLEC